MVLMFCSFVTPHVIPIVFIGQEVNPRIRATFSAPCVERKPPGIFCLHFIMRKSRSASLFVNGTAGSKLKGGLFLSRSIPYGPVIPTAAASLFNDKNFSGLDGRSTELLSESKLED